MFRVFSSDLTQLYIKVDAESFALQAHYAEFTGRDAAMSKSLNSDYLAQLYIKADTKSMDKELAKPGLASSGLPDEAKALVVYKRG